LQTVYYDFHIHTALSPCADDDMTPNDIVGMALLNGLDMIAITDHNSFANVASVFGAASGKDLIVLPGIEVSTAEEVHVLCLFSSMEKAHGFEVDFSRYCATLPNRKDIFGNQFLFDAEDNVIGELESILIMPTSITFDELYYLAQKHDAAFIPAHIDRDSFSVLSNLGFLPPHLKINTLEVSRNGVKNNFLEKNAGRFPENHFIFSSDAHQLWNIAEKEYFLKLPERSAEAAIDYLRS
jgi:hypothetical protein